MLKRLFALFILTLAMPAAASTLIEWDLPQTSVPVQIDGQHSGSLTFFFVDLGHSSINRIRIDSGYIAVHDEWRPPSFKGADPATIEVDGTTGYVWVTDPPNGAIGMLDPATDTYLSWRVKDVTGQPPVALAVDTITKQIWFTGYDGFSAPVVGHLDPWSGTVIWQALPKTVADTDDVLDAMVAPNPEQVYFQVVGPDNRLITHLKEPGLIFDLTSWPVPISESGQIALTASGGVATVLDHPAAHVAILEPGADKYTWWPDGLPGNKLSRWLSVLPNTDIVFLMGEAGPNVTRLHPTGGMTESTFPFVEIINVQIDKLEKYVKEAAPRSNNLLPPNVSFPTTDSAYAPFVHTAPVTTTGAISVYNSDQVFFTEISKQRVGWLIP